MHHQARFKLTRRQALASVIGGAATSIAGPLAMPAIAQGLKPFQIGVLGDEGGPYSGQAGPGAVLGARLAIEDFGGKALGRPIEVLVGDHQNKPDLGATIARGWLDNGMSAIVDGGSSAVGVALQNLTKEKNRFFLNNSASTADLYGKLCTQNAVQWITDTYSASTASVQALMKSNPALKKWFTIVVDYTAGIDMENVVKNVVAQGGGQMVGAARFPLGNADFSSLLLQAQNAGAQGIALGTSGQDLVNCLKQAHEFGLHKSIALVGLVGSIADMVALGPEVAEGLVWTTNFYWDRNDASRAFTKRFRAQYDHLPTRNQVGAYGSVFHYLRAVAAVGGDGGTAVFAKMQELVVSDPLFAGSRIRADGKAMVPQFVLRNKAPSAFRYPDDRAEIIASLTPDETYRSLADGGCPFVKT